MSTTVGALAQLVGGTVAGDSQYVIDGLADLVSAGPTDVSFLTHGRYRSHFDATGAGAVLVGEGFVAPLGEHARLPNLIRCPNPYAAMAQVARTLYPRGHLAGFLGRKAAATPAATTGQTGQAPKRWAGAWVSPRAQVDPSAHVGPGAVVEAGAVVGAGSLLGAQTYVGINARVGCDCVLHPGAKVLAECSLGNRVILNAGAVVGSDGFGFAEQPDGRRSKIPQLGVVVVEDDVEVGANSTIDRATLGETRVGAGTKIDNLVQVAHNVKLGKDCVLVSQSGIAGSATLRDKVIVGAQGGVVGHITLASGVVLAGRGGAASDIRQPGVYADFPAMPHRAWLKTKAAARAVPEMRRKLQQIANILFRDAEPGNIKRSEAERAQERSAG